MTRDAAGTLPLPVLHALFADAAVAVLIAAGDSAGTGTDGPPIVFANAALSRLTGEPIDSLVGRGCLTLLAEATEETARARAIACMHGAGRASLDVWTIRKDTSPYPARWDILPLLDAEGRVSHRVVIAHDLMAQRSAERGLETLRGVARRTGHDFNNMLTSLMVNLTPLGDASLSDDQREACLSDALEAARGGKDLTRQLLDAVRDGDSSDTIREVLPRLAQSAEWAKVKASREMDEDAVSIASARGALLIFDDDEKVLRMMAGFLEHEGYYVSATPDPGQCIARYREALAAGRCFDLVILDLMMDDGKEGVVTLAALQAIDPDVRALAHSGSAYADVMTAPTLHGFVGAVEKPTPLADLAATVDALLREAP